MIHGCSRFTMDPHTDARGELYKPLSSEYADIRECFYSWSAPGVLRGMHWQPYQAKIAVCMVGQVLDVLLDMRKESSTYRKHYAIALYAGSGIYLPPGVAHGFYVPDQRSLMLYLTTKVYNPTTEQGVRWDSFGCNWGCSHPVLSDRDQGFQPL